MSPAASLTATRPPSSPRRQRSRSGGTQGEADSGRYVPAWSNCAGNEKRRTRRKASCSRTDRCGPPEMQTDHSERSARDQDGSDNLARYAARFREEDCWCRRGQLGDQLGAVTKARPFDCTCGSALRSGGDQQAPPVRRAVVIPSASRRPETLLHTWL